jgi:uncharacterized protein (TIGR02145 family)
MCLKRPGALFTIILILSIFISCSRTLKDQDGNSLGMIKVGDQLWMSENLNVSHFRNGDEIPEAKSNEEWVRLGYERKPAWCYGKNNPDNSNKYAKLYNWYAVNDPRGLAPKGWHVASFEEWTSFINTMGNEVLAAMFMRGSGLRQIENRSGTIVVKFPPGGARDANGGYFNAGSHGYWWSATENGDIFAWGKLLNFVECNLYSLDYNKAAGFSVRCVRN